MPFYEIAKLFSIWIFSKYFNSALIRIPCQSRNFGTLIWKYHKDNIYFPLQKKIGSNLRLWIIKLLSCSKTILCSHTYFSVVSSFNVNVKLRILEMFCKSLMQLLLLKWFKSSAFQEFIHPAKRWLISSALFIHAFHRKNGKFISIA